MSETFANSFFNATHYLQNNPDVLAAIARGQFSSALEHFKAFGQFEGRAPNALFNPNQYLLDNPDVLAAVSSGVFASAWDHFVNFGAVEGRATGNFTGFFDEASYLAANPDVAAAVASKGFVSGYQHFLLFGHTEGRAGFNADGDAISRTRLTLTLTTGVDEGPAFTGGPADDLFRGTETMLTPFDSLDGGAGNDTLRLVLNTGLDYVPGGVEVTNIENVKIQSGANVGYGSGAEGSTFDISNWTGVKNVDVTASGPAGHVNLVTGAVETIKVTASHDAYLQAPSAETINVKAGDDAYVTVGSADTITATAGDDVTINATGHVGSITANAGWDVDVTVGSADTITATASDDVTINATGHVGSITATAGWDADVTAGSADTIIATADDDVTIEVTAHAGTITATAGWDADVTAGSADSITVNAGGDADVRVVGHAESINVTADGEWSDVNVEVEGTAGSIEVVSSDDATVHVGYVYAPALGMQLQGIQVQEEVDPYLPSGSEGSVETVNVTAGDDAHVDVAGNAGSITVDARDNAEVYVGWNQYSEENSWSGTGSAGTVDVTAGNDAEINVAGSAEAITVNAGGDANVYVGWGAEDGEAPGTAGTINVTAGSDDVSWSGDVNIEVAGDATSITVDSGEDVDVRVGYEYPTVVEGVTEWTTVVSSVGILNITADDEVDVEITGNAEAITIVAGRDENRDGDVYVDVAGKADSITVDARGDVDIDVGFGNDGDTGAAGTAGTIDVTAGDDADIEVAGHADRITVDAGDDVDVRVGYEYPTVVDSVTEWTTVVSSVQTLEITAGNDVNVDITGNAGDITITAGRDPEHNGEVDVNVGGSIASLSITGAKDENWHQQAVYVSAASIGSLSLKDINKAELNEGSLDLGDAQHVQVELTNSDTLNLAIAGARIDLSVEGVGQYADESEVDVETLNLTVGTFEKVLESPLPAVAEEPAPTPTVIDSYVALNSAEVQTLNIDGAGNLELDVSEASALKTIDAHEATGNITVELPGYEGAPISYFGGSGVDHVTLGALPEAVGTGWNFTLDGGAGDADKLTMSAALASGAGVAGSHGAITNFEVLNLTGVQAAVIAAEGANVSVDATLFGTDHVILDGVGPYEAATHAALDLTIADGGTVEVVGSGVGGTSTGGSGSGYLNVDVATAEGDSGSLTLVLNGGEHLLDSNLPITGIDLQTQVTGAAAISLVSNGQPLDLTGEVLVPPTVNSLGLTSDATTVTITGTAFLDLTDDLLDLAGQVFGGGTDYQSQTDLGSVTTIDASQFHAGLALDLSDNEQAMTITVGNGLNIILSGDGKDTITVGNGLNVVLAGGGNDIITVGDGSQSLAAQFTGSLLLPAGLGNIVWGGDGKDLITFADHTTANVLVYTHAHESNGVNVDVITGFKASFVAQNGDLTVTGHDLLDFSAFAADWANLEDTDPGFSLGYYGETDGYGAVLTALSAGHARFVLDSSTDILYGDVNADGQLNDSDFAIKLADVTDLSAANFNFNLANYGLPLDYLFA